ncbi:hypothetical protein EJ05DRAFT_223538 [Pseudovirgaria hyperparasitica]|uniref:Uncharacterized protein n=1 Tax=Pseudovirgaria hyperparasitica TaxID=470096 RepID=A0A6A6VUC9_9PEZI|nr:uncharacterized protein EJ05DRAFT_223538 [Pseudovirgaria hyperparasitica]KAF2753220.1 hypothetical protein EJ05DRAFT_223538 [Pseudovirgaria hyperparasitica]
MTTLSPIHHHPHHHHQHHHHVVESMEPVDTNMAQASYDHDNGHGTSSLFSLSLSLSLSSSYSSSSCFACLPCRTIDCCSRKSNPSSPSVHHFHFFARTRHLHYTVYPNMRRPSLCPPVLSYSLTSSSPALHLSATRPSAFSYRSSPAQASYRFGSRHHASLTLALVQSVQSTAFCVSFSSCYPLPYTLPLYTYPCFTTSLSAALLPLTALSCNLSTTAPITCLPPCPLLPPSPNPLASTNHVFPFELEFCSSQH